MPAPVHAKLRPNTKPLVVIDPGHGGSDAGAMYVRGATRVAEKDIALWISKDVAQELESRGVRVVLTRWDDQDVPLKDRTALANRLRAKAFLSIHLNSESHDPARRTMRGPGLGKTGGQGFETYILNNSSEASSYRLAKLENAVLSDSIADVDPQQNQLGLILKDHLLDANLGTSKRLACRVQSSLVQSLGGVNRGVKQALFYVLLGADMPSILVEAGFLSHADDRSKLLDRAYRRRMARALAQAISVHLARDPAAAHADSNCKIL